MCPFEINPITSITLEYFIAFDLYVAVIVAFNVVAIVDFVIPKAITS